MTASYSSNHNPYRAKGIVYRGSDPNDNTFDLTDDVDMSQRGLRLPPTKGSGKVFARRPVDATFDLTDDAAGPDYGDGTFDLTDAAAGPAYGPSVFSRPPLVGPPKGAQQAAPPVGPNHDYGDIYHPHTVADMRAVLNEHYGAGDYDGSLSDQIAELPDNDVRRHINKVYMPDRDNMSRTTRRSAGLREWSKMNRNGSKMNRNG